MPTGVTVTLEAIDPNNNYQLLGTTATYSYGNYGFSYEPEVPGTYMIMATFSGSDAYYSSTTTTYLTVDPAPTATTPIEPEQPEPEVPVEPAEVAETPFITTEIAIIAAVAIAAIIGMTAYWILKRR